MSETTLRLIDPDISPTESIIREWIGNEAFENWEIITHFIDENYPDIFHPEWLFGGKKHGWYLRYKKSKSFCSLVPEKGRLYIQIVFGAEERNKVELILGELSAGTVEKYDKAKTYHDGKWLFLEVDSNQVIADIQHLLAVKRRSKVRK